jgi:hypothetical protein
MVYNELFDFFAVIHIYTKTKYKTFIEVFTTAFIYSSLVIVDMLTPTGIIQSENKYGDTTLCED